MHQHNHEWYDPLHIIIWPLWSIDLDLACSSPLPWSIGAKSCPSFTASRSVASKPWLALHHCNRSIKPSLVLIFSTLVTWLHVMSHMQWAPSHRHMWTNHLCISICHIISPPNVVTQLPKPNKDLSISSFFVIDDNTTKILKLIQFVNLKYLPILIDYEWKLDNHF